MSYVMCGITKDIVAVVVAVIVLKEDISAVQTVGFLIQLASIGSWAVLKNHNDKFEQHGIRIVDGRNAGGMGTWSSADGRRGNTLGCAAALGSGANGGA